jgi:hypothetical protein
MTILSWLVAPVAGVLAGSLPLLGLMMLGTAGYDLGPIFLLMAAVVVLWIALAALVGWARASGSRRTHVLLCLALFLVGVVGPYLAARGGPEVTTVERIL